MSLNFWYVAKIEIGACTGEVLRSLDEQINNGQ